VSLSCEGFAARCVSGIGEGLSVSRYGVVVWLLAFGLAGPSRVRGAGESADLLQLGVRQTQEGSLEDALLTLDAAIRSLRELPPSPERDRDLVQAHLHRGIAYLNLGQEPLARVAFVQVLSLAPGHTLSPDEYPLRIRRVFEETRHAFVEKRSLEVATRQKGHRTALILGGLGLAAGGAAAAILGPEEHERINRPPEPRIVEWSPAGAPVARVTWVTFRAAGSDPDGEPISFSWSFGCGGGSAEGPIVRTVFDSAGQCPVTLTAKDGLGAVGRAEATIAVTSLVGRWLPSSQTLCRTSALTVTEVLPDRGGVRLECSPEPGWQAGCASTYVISPRSFVACVALYASTWQMHCLECLDLEVAGDGQTLQGTDTCYVTQFGYRCDERTRGVTLTRE
jgi:hypothetical protein